MRKGEIVIGITLLAIMFATGIIAGAQQIYWDVKSEEGCKNQPAIQPIWYIPDVKIVKCEDIYGTSLTPDLGNGDLNISILPQI